MAREQISLDGEWQFVLDARNVGKCEGWFVGDVSPLYFLPIKVPSCWQEKHPHQVGVGWYQRDVEAPHRWEGKRVHLTFWAVNYFAEVWVNGHFAGCHEGGYTPFTLEISRLLTLGEMNTLSVRVVNPPQRGAVAQATFEGYVAGEETREARAEGIDGFILDEVPNWKQQFYYNFGGIWQPVELTLTDSLWTEDVFIQPCLADSAADLVHTLRNDGEGERTVALQYRVVSTAAPEMVVAQHLETCVLPAGETKRLGRLTIPEPNLWSPDSPHLYRLLVFILEEGRAVDEWSHRFGMREFSVRNHFFHLNGQKILMKSALHQGNYARTLAYPETEELARREITLAKEAGLNMLRIHIKPAPKRFIELADEMGLMLHEEPPIGWMKANPKLREREEREVRELVLRDRNNASVVMWGILNETSNKGGVQIAGSVAIMHDLCLIARDLDPTRIILDDSGGYGNGTNAYMPYSAEPVGVRDMHRYGPAPITEFDHRAFSKLGQPDQLSFMTEFGASGLEDFGLILKQFDRPGDERLEDYQEMKGFYDYLDTGLKRHGLTDMFPDVYSFCRAAQECQAEADRLLIEAMRINPRMAGWCLTQFNDASMEIGAGVLDIFRNTKAAYFALKEVTHPLYLVVHAHPRTAYAGGTTGIAVTLVNEGVLSGACSVFLEVTTPSGVMAHEALFPLLAGAAIQPVIDLTVQLPSEEGYYRATATLIQDGGKRTENAQTFLVLDPAAHLPEKPFMVLDPEGNLAPWLDRNQANWRDFTFAEGATSATVLIANMKHSSGYYAIYDQLRQVSQMVTAGATAIFLEGNFNELMYLFLRFVVGHTGGGGGLGGNFHYVKPHPVFAGLPSGCLMDWEYANLWARETIKEICIANLDPETLVGIVAAGEDPALWNTDMLITRQGLGRVLLSKLELGAHLGQDPVADRMVLNMVRWGMEA
ncbi:MAG: sugar-binding domain-containing protein [Candidatus Latescibacterota bacterium]